MEKIVVRLKDYKNNKVIKNKKVFDNFDDVKNYIELLFTNLKENECIKLKFVSDKYLSKHGEIYTNFTSEELEYTYHVINKWLNENEVYNKVSA